MNRPSAAAALAAAVTLASCGGGGGTKGGYATGQPVKGKRGGTLGVLSRGDVDSVDPGAAYYQFTYIVTYATQRPLFSYRPDDPVHAVPDLAVQGPKVSDGGRTVTVRLREGVRFSPPVRREVTSADVKYAIERGFNPNVGNAYARAYFGSVVGADRARGGPIAGIRTPDRQTIVFRLSKRAAATVIGALSLPLSAPVPPELARRLDRRSPSGYGARQVATGPYMISGYRPGRSITLTRNPGWDRETDHRPAYLDRIVISEGNGDPIVAARRILRGRGLVNAQGNLDVPPAIVEQVVAGSARQRRQFVAGASTGSVRYVSLNPAVAPFDDVDVRRAVAAGLDRAALRRALGGPLAGDVATHFLPPAVPGFEQAGGHAGPGFDFLERPGGDRRLAAAYLRRAGYPSGRYTGVRPLVMVADDRGTARAVAAAVRAQLERLGFPIAPRFVAPGTQSCGPDVPICASTGWQRDFPDPGSAVWPRLDSSAIRAAMARDASIVDPGARARAWGRIDRRVTALVSGVPWLWDRATGIESRDVNGVVNRFTAAWDLSFTSLR